MKTEVKIARFAIILLILIVIITFASIATASAIDKRCMGVPVKNAEYLDSLKKYTKTYSYRNSDSFENFEVEYRGKIVVSEDDKDILSISPNGFFRVAKSSFGNKRIINIAADASGNLTKEYYEGKSKKDFNSQGKSWLSDILPDLVLQTGISAEERIDRLVRKSFSAVLDELEKLNDIKYYNESNVNFVFYNSRTEYSRNVFYLYQKIIVDRYQLTKNELYNFLKQVKKIGSNATKGTILREILAKYSLDADLMNVFLLTTASLDYNTEKGAVLRAFVKKYKIASHNSETFFKVVDDISIRSEKGNVLKPLFREQNMDKPTFLRFIKSVGLLTSESEKGAILYEIMAIIEKDKDFTAAFINVVNNMDDSYSNFKEDLIMQLANANNSTDLKENKTILIGLLKNARDYSTNTKKFILLRKINYVFIEDKEFLYEYFNVIDGMDNEFLRYNLLLHLIENKKISSVTAIPFFNAVSKLCDQGFSHAGGAILREYIKQWPESKVAREQFFETVDRIEFSCTVEELLLLLADRKDLQPDDIFNIIKSTKKIEMDAAVATVLIKVKPLISANNSEARYIFNSAARKMELEYEFNKVVAR